MDTNRYSLLERMVHNMAFASRAAQIAMADLEDKQFARQLQAITPERPVFVTALPRAGTTLLLEMLENTGEFGVHIYRDMPFLLTPIWWARMSHWFQQDAAPQERAHGDGMLVSVDSPEAFEETLWAEFWQQQYRKRWVEPWNARFRHDEFERFFRAHMRKILYLRQTETQHPNRYLSKNNMNISRLGYLTRRFEDAQVIVPFRHPLQHAASLLKQHLGFLRLHQQDHFARRYMRKIGHYDFGENLKPINFNGWLHGQDIAPATELNFWLQYWCEAYTSILDQCQPAVALFGFDQLGQQPEASLQQLANLLQLEDPTRLTGQSSRVAAPRPHPLPPAGLDPVLRERAEALYARLVANALNQ